MGAEAKPDDAFFIDVVRRKDPDEPSPFGSGRCVCGKGVGKHSRRHTTDPQTGRQTITPGLWCGPGNDRYREV